jgi:hypothetical protein
MPDELTRYRERFLPKKLEINVDGICEEWEYEMHEVGDKLVITYRLKNKTKYKTDV